MINIVKFELTEQQKLAKEKTIKWWKTQDKQVFEISGAAGTGKTTIVYTLIDELGLDHDDVLFMAYVGKATLALAMKGNFAQTIHSSIYELRKVPMVDELGNVVLENNRVVDKLEFIKKDYLPSNIKLIVVDEGAMVPENIAKDILSFDIPVIVLGDNNQLPPIFGNSYFLNHPDVELTEPMRQALDSPIIHLAMKAMHGDYIKIGKYGNSYVIKKDMITDNMLTNSDIVICGRNRTRDELNRRIREDILKINKQYPIIGDKVICRRNNWNRRLMENIFLINGMVGYIEDVNMESFNGRSIKIDFRPEFLKNKMFENIEIDFEYLTAPFNQKKKGRSYYDQFEYAYAITTHLSQGSEYENVFIYDEVMGDRDFYRKWLYTAITRASNGLILAL